MSIPDSRPPAADYIIVGAGTASCVLARRLTEQTDATVVEPARWVHNVGAPYDDRTLYLSRGKVLGGSGSTNALLWVSGHRHDFDQWAQAGASSWDYDSVLPYFRRCEDWEDGASEIRGAGARCTSSARHLYPVATALIEVGISLRDALARRHQRARAGRSGPDQYQRGHHGCAPVLGPVICARCSATAGSPSSPAPTQPGWR